MKTSLLAIDPGARTGYAWFQHFVNDGWFLQGGGVCSPDSAELLGDPFNQVVIENPVIYPHSKARPADILTLARIVGRYQERFRHCPIELVEPRRWKGTIDPDIMLRRIEVALTARDRAVYNSYTGGYKHNFTDAVGLGKWAVAQPFMAKDRK
jgi:hypothetical protein